MSGGRPIEYPHAPPIHDGVEIHSSHPTPAAQPQKNLRDCRSGGELELEMILNRNTSVGRDYDNTYRPMLGAAGDGREFGPLSKQSHLLPTIHPQCYLNANASAEGGAPPGRTVESSCVETSMGGQASDFPIDRSAAPTLSPPSVPGDSIRFVDSNGRLHNSGPQHQGGVVLNRRDPELYADIDGAAVSNTPSFTPSTLGASDAPGGGPPTGMTAAFAVEPPLNRDENGNPLTPGTGRGPPPPLRVYANPVGVKAVGEGVGLFEIR